MLISSTSLADFRRCRRKYYYQWELLLEQAAPSDVMSAGTEFHKLMELAALGGWSSGGDDSMREVAAAYLKAHPLPTRILSVEQPVWVTLLSAEEAIEPVFMRCTFDLTYQDDDGWYVIRDYKTFEKKPTIEVDMDFQGKLYAAVGRRIWGTDKVRFEYEMVRQYPPNVLKPGKTGGMWAPEECYLNVPIYSSDRECNTLWLEAKQTAQDILFASPAGRWYRTPVKGSFPGACGKCPVKDVCLADLMRGLSADEIESLPKRQPLNKDTF